MGDFDGIIARRLELVQPIIFRARIVDFSWGQDLVWSGIVLCAIASLLWIYSSKVLRRPSSVMAT